MSYYVTNENSFLDIKNAHLRVTGNVHTDVLKLGAIEFQPTGSEVTGTVNFTNVTTGVTTSSNLNVGGTLQLGTVEVVATTHTLANTTALGNVTPHTIEVSNVTTGLVTTANVSVGRDLTVTGNVAVDTDTLFVDTVNDRVGIGTVSPGYLLDVQSTSDAADKNMTRLYSAANASGVSSTGLRVEKGTGYGGIVKGFISQGVGSGLSLHTLNGGTDVQAMTIMNSGNVGIGTASPDKAKLQINNTLALLNPSYKSASDDDQLAGKIEFYLGGSSNELSTPVAAIEGYDKYAGGSYAGALALKVHGGEKMRILSNGNVGIGTMIPGAKLDVSGNIRGSGLTVQTVSSSKTDTTSFAGTSVTDISGLSVTITPKFDNSKILISYDVSMGGQGRVFLRVKRVQGSSTTYFQSDQGAGGGTQTPGAGAATSTYAGSNTDTEINGFSFKHLDDAGGLGSITYTVQGWTNHSVYNVFINRGMVDTAGSYWARCVSSITAQEVCQ
jgi:hypothetical protein